MGAKLVGDFLLDITPNEEIEKFRVYELNQAYYRENGTGKPSTKNRRELESFFDWQEDEE